MDMKKVRQLGIDKGRLKTKYRGYDIRSLPNGRIEVADDSGFLAEVMTVGEAMRFIDRQFPDPPTAA